MSQSYNNFLEIYHQSIEKYNTSPCLRFKEDGRWQILNWQEVNQKVMDLVGGLSRLGIQKGDKVCIFSRSRYEWTLSDLAILFVAL